jgi:hypothetical protein
MYSCVAYVTSQQGKVSDVCHRHCLFGQGRQSLSQQDDPTQKRVSGTNSRQKVPINMYPKDYRYEDIGF